MQLVQEDLAAGPEPDRADTISDAARRASLEDVMDTLLVEAAIANAVNQRARNAGRIALLPEDIAMVRLLRRLMLGACAPESRTEVARLVALEAMAERGVR